MTNILVDVEIVPEQCCNCGVYFGMDKYLVKRLKETGDSFYCPNGHPQYYTQKEQLESKIKELESQLQEAETENRYLFNDLGNVKRSLSATKGVLTRTKNRIHNGVCPVCNRQFINLHRHMTGQHPDYNE